MNIRQVRKKIKTIGNVKKITRAMELVSAIKMKKAQQEANDGKPYRETLETVIERVTKLVNPKLSKLLQINLSDKELIILISSNKGLCGAFNFNLFRYCSKNINPDKSDIITVGRKANLIANKINGKIIADFSSNKAVTSVLAIFQFILEKFLNKQYKQVSIIYNKFISTLNYEPVKELILPIKLLPKDTTSEFFKKKEEYLIEPSAEEIIDPLLNNFVEEKIRGAIISSEAGEHSARMIAMKNATDNSNDIIYELTLLRNRLRQEKITYELLDMITAKESVEIS